jgi:excisionase family DNA binding protein
MPEHNDPDPRASEGALLTAGDVARLLGVPTTWVYAETRAGRLPHVALGRYRRYRRTALDAWIDAHERGPARRQVAAADREQPR